MTWRRRIVNWPWNGIQVSFALTSIFTDLATMFWSVIVILWDSEIVLLWRLMYLQPYNLFCPSESFQIKIWIMQRRQPNNLSWFRQHMRCWATHRREPGKWNDLCILMLHTNLLFFFMVSHWTRGLYWDGSVFCVLKVRQSQGGSSKGWTEWRLWRWQHRPPAVFYCHLLLWLWRRRGGEWFRKKLAW